MLLHPGLPLQESRLLRVMERLALPESSGEPVGSSHGNRRKQGHLTTLDRDVGAPGPPQPTGGRHNLLEGVERGGTGQGAIGMVSKEQRGNKGGEMHACIPHIFLDTERGPEIFRPLPRVSWVTILVPGSSRGRWGEVTPGWLGPDQEGSQGRTQGL